MIVRPRLHWLRMLFVLRGSVLPLILPRLLLIALLSTAVAATHGMVGDWKLPLTPMPFTLLGLALAIFLGFRNNASYDRWWEARKLWGRLLVDGRNLTRQALTLIDGPADRRAFVHLLIAFSRALRHQLRAVPEAQARTELAPLLTPGQLARVEQAAYRPATLLLLAAEWLRERRVAGELDTMRATAMETSLNGLSDVLGGCERIASTPLPFTYSVILHRTSYVYCLLLPFGLVDSIGYMTPLMATFVAYTFFALEELSHELEEPFGDSPNDLPLDALDRMIERALRDLLGEQPLPPALQPVDGILN